MGGWWGWALVSPDGVAPSRMVNVSSSVNLPLHHKVQKFSSGTASPVWSRKKGHKKVVVWCAGGLLWPNGCMYGIPLGAEVDLSLGNIVLGGDPAPPTLMGGTAPSPQFLANVRYGQMAGWTKMPLGMEVGLGPGDFVFDGDPAPPEKKGTAPPRNFWPISIVAKRLDGSRCHLIQR